MSIKTRISELFNYSTSSEHRNWKDIIANQHCHFIGKKCLKIRKSSPEISIGTCSAKYGRENQEIIICPYRLLERRQIFIDCLHLLNSHEPGNEIHIIPEVSIPGGSVDFFIASVKEKKVKDFVGIELQALDTTGTLWPERQRLLETLGVVEESEVPYGDNGYGMNWKMTAKTILVQLHHKVDTFEHLNKHIVLVLQDHLLNYMQREFAFSHLSTVPKLGDPMHFHSYKMTCGEDNNYHINLVERLSTSSAGIAAAMGLQAEAKVELEIIIRSLETKISRLTLFTI